MVMTKAKAEKCLVCGKRPATQSQRYCKVCNDKIEADRRRSKPEKPEKFLTFKGHVVGLFRNDRGTFTPRLLKRNAEKLPKYMTINLNVYQKGYTREQIRSFKRAVLNLAS